MERVEAVAPPRIFSLPALFFFLAPKRAQGELSQGEARVCCAGEGWRVEGTEEPVGRPVAGAALMESNTRRQSGRRSLCQRGS